MRWVLLMAALALPATAAAEGRPDRGNGYFFNKPGATLAQFDTDLRACEALARGTATQFVPGGVPSPVGIATGLFFSALSAGRQRRINRENCVLVEGWRVYAFDTTQGRAWRDLSDEARATRLAALVGAEAPDTGIMIRRWTNDYAEPVYDQD